MDDEILRNLLKWYLKRGKLAAHSIRTKPKKAEPIKLWFAQVGSERAKAQSKDAPLSLKFLALFTIIR